MESKFWASVVAIITEVLIVVFEWLLFGKPNLEHDTGMAWCVAVIALYFSLRNDLLRKED